MGNRSEFQGRVFSFVESKEGARRGKEGCEKGKVGCEKEKGCGRGFAVGSIQFCRVKSGARRKRGVREGKEGCEKKKKWGTRANWLRIEPSVFHKSKQGKGKKGVREGKRGV